jgi:eukaryotic translation initiation factor 2C
LFSGEVKRVAEIVLGVMTQCVVKANIMKCMEKQDRMTTTNIAMKMNMKMGGTNSLAESNELAKQALMAEPTLVLGIDVTHPGPTEKKMPSISSVSLGCFLYRVFGRWRDSGVLEPFFEPVIP